MEQLEEEAVIEHIQSPRWNISGRQLDLGGCMRVSNHQDNETACICMTKYQWRGNRAPKFLNHITQVRHERQIENLNVRLSY
jgi:hypothetical protein